MFRSLSANVRYSVTGALRSYFDGVMAIVTVGSAYVLFSGKQEYSATRIVESAGLSAGEGARIVLVVGIVAAWGVLSILVDLATTRRWLPTRTGYRLVRTLVVAGAVASIAVVPGPPLAVFGVALLVGIVVLVRLKSWLWKRAGRRSGFEALEGSSPLPEMEREIDGRTVTLSKEKKTSARKKGGYPAYTEVDTTLDGSTEVSFTVDSATDDDPTAHGVLTDGVRDRLSAVGPIGQLDVESRRVECEFHGETVFDPDRLDQAAVAVAEIADRLERID